MENDKRLCALAPSAARRTDPVTCPSKQTSFIGFYQLHRFAVGDGRTPFREPVTTLLSGRRPNLFVCNQITVRLS